MHAWLAFITGVFATIGAFLLFAALSGTTYYGLAIQVEETIAGTLIVIAAIVAWIFYVGIKAQYKKIKTGIEALIGAKGIVTTDLKPTGQVRVLGEFWQATAKEGEINAGKPIQVVGMDGMFLIVVPAEQKA